MSRVGCYFSFLLLATAVLAQDTSSGAIRGTVSDSAGARIGAANVVLVNTATNFRYSAASDVSGRFVFDLLAPGEYSARADSPGMSPQTTPRLRVDVGGTTELTFRLAVAGASETVTVSGEPPLIESQPSGISTLIDERAINELPLNGRRYTDLALLTPGVTQDPRGLTSGSNGFGRSSILPRQTREHRLHLAETLSMDGKRNSWKCGGDVLMTWIYNFFPSLSGGEYIFDPIKVNPFTFEIQEAGLELTPLRAYAHQVPHYYLQSFGPAVTHPDTNEYAGFAQDTIRVSDRLALSLGARYDLQTFTTKGLQANPLWPDAGRVPYNTGNFAPRVGLAYSVGNERPLVIRAGFGIFYTRIPQIYNSAVQSDSGLAGNFLFLNNNNFFDHQVFPQYPNPLVNCAVNATNCQLPSGLAQLEQADVSAFSHNFRTPPVQQASLNVEREMAHRMSVGVSYMYVHGVDLIRARDVNLPPPVNVSYPVYDPSGTNFLGTYYDVDSFSTLQATRSLTCPFPPCVNPRARPIPQLGSINVFESAASSVYHGATLSIRRRMTSGVYFMLAYTFAHAIDDGQDALVAGRPATVQDSYVPDLEKGPSVTDQRQRFVFSFVLLPKPFYRDHEWLGLFFNNWKAPGVFTYGSGWPVSATVTGDANHDGNNSNDRLPGLSRNSLVGPDYATTDMRLTRRLYAGDRQIGTDG